MDDLAERVEAIVGQRVVAVDEIPGAGGYTPALRRIATLAGGSTVFVKVPTNDVTRWMLVNEIAAYDAIGPQPFCPTIISASPEGLVLEDLRHGHWPPPWRDGDVERVRAALDVVARTSVPALPTIEQAWGDAVRSWGGVDVDAVAALGFDRGLVAAATVAGREIEADATFDGDALLHLDVRSDNLCLLDDRVVLVDWNGACRGQAGLDQVTWAPSLTLEGGPQPWELLPDAALHHVAFVAGFFANRAPQPVIPDAPGVRPFQLAQLQVALPWFARLLEISS